MEHIITAVFEPGKIRTVASEPLFQWDYGQTLVFSGIELPTAYQVDFSNFEYCGNSIPQIGGADGVTVPVDVLTTGRDVYAFVWLQDADSGRTRYMAQISVIPRPVPDLDDPNPEQESAIAEAIAALNAGVAAAEAAQAAAEQSAEDAGESAQTAAGSAAAAAGSASEAGSARDAAQAAQAAAEAAQTAAEQSAEDAAESAQDAAGSAAAAAGSAAEAGSAVRAAEAAQAAAEAAEEAAVQIAEAARGSAQAAAGSAAAAAESVTDAGSAASAALQSAVAAGESAQAAAGSATSAGSAASAAAASATDAGNAQTAAETAQAAAEDAQEAAETAQGAAEAAAASVSASSAQIAQNTADIASLEEDRYKAFATDTASGAIASFSDGADDIPVKDLTVAVEPVQDLHGYDAPWPAGGGINLIDKVSNESYGGTVSADGLTVTSKEVTASGSSNFMRAVFSNPFDAVTSETLYVSFDVRLLAGTMDRFNIQLVGGSNYSSIGISKYANVPSTAKQRISFSGSPNRDDQIRGIYIQAQNADGAQLEISNIQISKIEDYNYHPYSNICPISGWAGANIAQGSGLLEITSFQQGTFTRSGQTTGAMYAVRTYFLTVESNTEYAFKCDLDGVTLGFFSYDTGTGNPQATVHTSADGKEVRITTGKNDLFVRATIVLKDQTKELTPADVDKAYLLTVTSAFSITFPTEAGTVYGGALDWTNKKIKARPYYANYNGEALAGPWISSMDAYAPGTTPTIGAQVVDMGGAEIIYDLAVAPEIDTLHGANNIWADCGDSTVEYRADTKLYIDKKIAALAAALS